MTASCFTAQRLSSAYSSGTGRQNHTLVLGSGDWPQQSPLDCSRHDAFHMEPTPSIHVHQGVETNGDTDQRLIPPDSPNIYSPHLTSCPTLQSNGSFYDYEHTDPPFFSEITPVQISSSFPTASWSASVTNFELKCFSDQFPQTQHDMGLPESKAFPTSQYEVRFSQCTDEYPGAVQAPHYNEACQGWSLLPPLCSAGWNYDTYPVYHGCNSNFEDLSSDNLLEPTSGFKEDEYINFGGCEEPLTQRSIGSEQRSEAHAQSPVNKDYFDNSHVSISTGLTDVDTVEELAGSSPSEIRFTRVENDTGSRLSDDCIAEEANTICGSLSPSDSCSNAATLCDQQSPEPPQKSLPRTLLIPHAKVPSKPSRKGHSKALPEPPCRTASTDKRCTMCNKMFLKNHQLNKHRLTHTRPFRCSICTFKASVKRDLRRHVESVHANCGAGYYCEVLNCDRSARAEVLKPFGRHDNLVRHGRKIHGMEVGKQAKSR